MARKTAGSGGIQPKHTAQPVPPPPSPPSSAGPPPPVLAVFHDAGLAGAELVLLSHLKSLREQGGRVVAVVPRPGALVQPLRAIAERIYFHPAPWWIRLQGSCTHARAWDMTARGGLKLRIDKSVATLRKIIEAEKVSAVVSAASVLLSPSVAARAAGVAALQFVHEWPGAPEADHRGTVQGQWDSAVSWRESLALLAELNQRLIWSSPACAVAWSGRPKIFTGTGREMAAKVAAAWRKRQHVTAVEQFLAHPVNFANYPMQVRGKPARLHPESNPWRLICVATWSHRKGTDRLFDILSALHQQHVPFTATLVGRQPGDRFTHALAAQFARAPFAGRVSIQAYADNLPALLTQHDVLVHPAREDTSPLVLAHALAAGLPIVASDLPGIREMLTGYRPKDAPCGTLLSATEIAPWVELLRAPGPLVNVRTARTAQGLAMATFDADAVHRQFRVILDAAIVAASGPTEDPQSPALAALTGAAGRRTSARAALWAVQDEAIDLGRGLVARLGGKPRRA